MFLETITELELRENNKENRESWNWRDSRIQGLEDFYSDWLLSFERNRESWNWRDSRIQGLEDFTQTDFWVLREKEKAEIGEIQGFEDSQLRLTFELWEKKRKLKLERFEDLRILNSDWLLSFWNKISSQVDLQWLFKEARVF